MEGEENVQYNGSAEHVTKISGWWGQGGFRRSFMAIIAIKFRKKVKWGQHSTT